MIPKVIHYCWFGHNPLPILAIKCIESWKKYLPDYEIKTSGNKGKHSWHKAEIQLLSFPYSYQSINVQDNSPDH